MNDHRFRVKIYFICTIWSSLYLAYSVSFFFCSSYAQSIDLLFVSSNSSNPLLGFCILPLRLVFREINRETLFCNNEKKKRQQQILPKKNSGIVMEYSISYSIVEQVIRVPVVQSENVHTFVRFLSFARRWFDKRSRVFEMVKRVRVS